MSDESTECYGERKANDAVVERVVNPRTGRWITVGGPAYWDLIGDGYTLREMRRDRQRQRPSRRFSRDSGVRSVRVMDKMRVSRGSRSRSGS